LNRRTHKPHDHHPFETTRFGQPLETDTRTLLEPKFQHDFSNVRVHADGEADAITRAFQARAFAFGDDLFFRDGAYDPTSSTGMYTLAHELTHVVQQSGSRNNEFSGQVTPSDSPSETEAHMAARAVVSGAPAKVSVGSADAAQISRMDENDPMVAAVSPMLPPPMPNAPNPQIPGPGRVPTNIPGLPETTPPGPGRVPPPPVGVGFGAGIAGALAGLATFLWPNKTAPRWMDEMNPLTGQPYASEQEFQQVQQEMHRRALEEQNAGTPSES
jgi:hypothetical protein